MKLTQKESFHGVRCLNACCCATRRTLRAVDIKFTLQPLASLENGNAPASLCYATGSFSAAGVRMAGNVTKEPSRCCAPADEVPRYTAALLADLATWRTQLRSRTATRGIAAPPKAQATGNHGFSAYRGRTNRRLNASTAA
jgi:hypothetical protein